MALPLEPERGAGGPSPDSRDDGLDAPADPAGEVAPDAAESAPGDPQDALRTRITARTRAARERGEEFVSDLERRRPESAVVETGFRWLARDKRIAGGILSGGLAYRFFFWLLALAVLTSGGLGLASRLETDVQKAIERSGVSVTVAESAADIGDQASFTSSLWLLLVGIWLVVWFGWGVLRALWLVHAAAWAVKPPPLRRIPQGVAGVVAVPFALVLLAGLATWTRSQLGLLPGLLATIAVGVALGGFWLWALTKLPSRPVPWTAHVPGALTVALGFEGLHLFSVYFLSDKLQSASNLYGVLGLAATLLFVLFMVGRMIVWSAEINAVSWDVRQERGRA